MRDARTDYNGEPGTDLALLRKRYKIRAATYGTTYLSQIREYTSHRRSSISAHAAGQTVKIRATKNTSPSSYQLSDDLMQLDKKF